MRPKISAYVITKNEEPNLPGCLESISWVDEIVVVDDNSTDHTVEIAKKAGCKVIIHAMESSPAQRKLALANCSSDWILWVDADERVPPSLRDEIVHRLEKDQGTYTGYYLLRLHFLLWRKVRWTEWSAKYYWTRGDQLKLTRKGKWHFQEDQTVHEVMVGDGRIGRLTRPLHHVNANPSLHVRIQKTIRYARLAAEVEYKRGRRIKWYDFAVRPFLAFVKSFVWFGGFLEGVNGWIIAWCNAMTEVCKCFYGYEAQQDQAELESRRREVQELWREV